MCIIRTFLSELVLFKLEIMYIVLGRHFTSKNLAVQLTNSFRNPRSSLYSCIGNVSSFPGYLLCCRLPFVNCARQLLDRSRPARAPRTGTAGRTGLKLLNTLKFEISNSTISNIVVISKIYCIIWTLMHRALVRTNNIISVYIRGCD